MTNEVSIFEDRLYNEPLLVHENTARYLEQLVQDGARILRPSRESVELGMSVGDINAALQDPQAIHGGDSVHRPYSMSDGVALINIRGYLEHDSMYYGSYWTGYDALKARIDIAAQDPEVRGIAFMVHSNGGEVAGNFDLSDHIHQLRGKIPTVAIVNESAYSAAYSLASAADKVYVNRTGGVGSIGVITVHMDRSKLMSDIGIKATLIFAGKHKVDGNPYEALSKDALTQIQGRIDGLYTIFVDTVARNRTISSDAVRATEAGVFSGEQAVEIGLADEVMSASDALEKFKSGLSGSSSKGVISMTTEKKPEAGGESGEVVAKAVHDQALATARTEALAEGVKAENERVLGILNCEEAKGREATARVLAARPDMTVEAAQSVLATVGEQAPEGDVLSLAMDKSGGGAGAGPGGEGGEQIKGPVIDAGKIWDKRNKLSA